MSETAPPPEPDGQRARHRDRDISDAIALRYDRLSRGQRRVVDRLMADTRYAAVVSAPELARLVGVSESTVTRAAQALGFAGYPDLQGSLQERLFSAVPERIAASVAEFGDTPEAAGIRVMLEDAETLRATAEDLLPATLGTVVDRLATARRVYVFGCRGSYGLAVILDIGLRLLVPDARLLNQTFGDIADQLVQVTADDVLVAISFRRVDRITVNVMKQAVAAGATTVAITDHLASPVARLASVTLLARHGPLRLMPTYAVGASLVNAIISVLAARTQDRARPSLQLAERLWQAFDVYAEQ